MFIFTPWVVARGNSYTSVDVRRYDVKLNMSFVIVKDKKRWIWISLFCIKTYAGPQEVSELLLTMGLRFSTTLSPTMPKNVPKLS